MSLIFLLQFLNSFKMRIGESGIQFKPATTISMNYIHLQEASDKVVDGCPKVASKNSCDYYFDIKKLGFLLYYYLRLDKVLILRVFRAVFKRRGI